MESGNCGGVVIEGETGNDREREVLEREKLKIVESLLNRCLILFLD